MQKTHPKLAAITIAVLLAACTDNTGLPPVAVSTTPAANPTISGLAATGAAMANADVTVKCSTGATIKGKTAADGSFNIELTGGQTAPCMVQVTLGGVTLHGFANAAGRINVTPLTDLVVTKALGSGAAAAFDSFDAAKGKTIAGALDAAKKYVSDSIKTILDTSPSGDLLTGVFKVGDADDKILDALAAALARGGKTLADLRTNAQAGKTLTPVDRGSLVANDAESSKVVTTVTKAALDTGGTSSGLINLSGPAQCDVKVVAINYNTIGVKGEATNASGVLLLPSGAGACATPKGLVAYAKGTDVQKPRTLANPADGETGLLAAMYAAQGYAVVATDYLGYAKSAYPYHPYLHADSEASAIVDAIRAARNAAATTAIGVTLPNKVFVTGYSQGGHASMAAHRAIERDNASEINVMGGAHLAGPYNLSGSLKVTSAVGGVQFFVPFLVTAWQKIYGDIYAKVSDAFKAPYDSYIETLLPSPTLTYTTLVTTGKLPGGPTVSPDQARDTIFQTTFTASSQTSNTNTLYIAAKKNDLLGWSPKAAVLLCGGSGDPTVPPAVHMTPMKADFDSRSLNNVTVVDVDPTILYLYGSLLMTDPATYYGNYHGTYEPPLCAQQAKKSFDRILNPPL